MGNAAQSSICFKSAWANSSDPNDIKSCPKKLWPVPVIDIDLIKGLIGDYAKNAKAIMFVNVASY